MRVDHLSLAGADFEDPVLVKLVQFDGLMEATLVHPHSGTVTWERGEQTEREH